MKKNLILLISLVVCISASAQPCKQVKTLMLSDVVLKLCGKPNSVDTLGIEKGKGSITIWVYGNQKVTFIGDKVENVIADAKRYDEVMLQFQNRKIKKEELQLQIDKINLEGCK